MRLGVACLEVACGMATEGLAQQRKMAKQKKKKAKVAEVMAEMIAVSENHAAELLEMLAEEPKTGHSTGKSKASSKSKSVTETKSNSRSKKKSKKKKKRRK